VLEPVADGINDHVIAASKAFATDAALLVRASFQRLAARALAEAISAYLQGGT
jgi:hypothetical protein